jgi:hypothetical protein
MGLNLFSYFILIFSFDWLQIYICFNFCINNDSTRYKQTYKRMYRQAGRLNCRGEMYRQVGRHRGKVQMYRQQGADVQAGRETENLTGIHTGGQAERCINSEVGRQASRKVIMWAGRQM